MASAHQDFWPPSVKIIGPNARVTFNRFISHQTLLLQLKSNGKVSLQ